MFKLIDKKIIAILRNFSLLNWPYGIPITLKHNVKCSEIVAFPGHTHLLFCAFFKIQLGFNKKGFIKSIKYIESAFNETVLHVHIKYFYEVFCGGNGQKPTGIKAH